VKVKDAQNSVEAISRRKKKIFIAKTSASHRLIAILLTAKERILERSRDPIRKVVWKFSKPLTLNLAKKFNHFLVL